MCSACGDTGYIDADKLVAHTIAIRKWCGNAPRVLWPCWCSPVRQRWEDDHADQQDGNR